VVGRGADRQAQAADSRDDPRHSAAAAAGPRGTAAGDSQDRGTHHRSRREGGQAAQAVPALYL
jgi:hypothetical protein